MLTLKMEAIQSSWNVHKHLQIARPQIPDDHIRKKIQTFFKVTTSKRVILEKLTDSQLFKKYLALVVSRKLITVFRRLHYWTLSWSQMKLVQTLILCIYFRLNIILRYTPKFPLLSLHFSFSERKSVCISRFSHACYDSNSSNFFSKYVTVSTMKLTWMFRTAFAIMSSFF